MNKEKLKTILGTVAIALVLFIPYAASALVCIDVRDRMDEIAQTANKTYTQLIYENQMLQSKITNLENYLNEHTVTVQDDTVHFETADDEDMEVADIYTPALSKERLPLGVHTNTMRGMDYRKITNHRSEQWALQMECTNDPEYGIRTYTDGENTYYCAALGSAYGRVIGDTFHVTLHCGTEFDIMLSEYKDDGTTDFFGHPDINYDGDDMINIIEFVIDIDCIPQKALDAGTMSAMKEFGGLYSYGADLISIEYTGQVWFANN